MNREIEEKEFIEFRKKAIEYFQPILIKEGYPPEKASKLAFFIAKILEDAIPLLECIAENETDIERVLDDIHLLYTNRTAFEEGKKVLMWED